jgi:cytochrome c biogenesis protein CcmG, thiol:disulfide interchange protein DsbE
MRKNNSRDSGIQKNMGKSLEVKKELTQFDISLVYDSVVPLRRCGKAFRLYIGLVFIVFGVVSAQRVGDTLPDFQLIDIDGNVVTPADFAGKPLLLNFWATWCPPCQEELPLFQDARDTTSDLQVFLVNTGESLETAKRYLESSNLTLASAVNSEGGEDTLEVTKRFRVRGMPTTFFVKGDGTVASIYVGQISETTLVERLAEIGVTWQP